MIKAKYKPEDLVKFVMPPAISYMPGDGFLAYKNDNAPRTWINTGDLGMVVKIISNCYGLAHDGYFYIILVGDKMLEVNEEYLEAAIS